jgi:hypothetical protein
VSLFREFKITSDGALKAACSFVQSNWQALNDAGTPIFLIVSSAEEKRRAAQNRYYWKIIIGSIVEQAWIHGKQFHADVWHEFCATKFGIHKELTLPDGRIILKRLSTSEMSVRDFSEYIEKCAAYGAQELAVRFPVSEQY